MMKFNSVAEVLRAAANMVERGPVCAPSGNPAGACQAVFDLSGLGCSSGYCDGALRAIDTALGDVTWFEESAACPRKLRIRQGRGETPEAYRKRQWSHRLRPEVMKARAKWLRYLAKCAENA